MKLTKRQRYILSFAARPEGAFLRTIHVSDYRWYFIRPTYDGFRLGGERTPSEREARKLLENGLVELVPEMRLGYAESNGVRKPTRAVRLTDKGRKAFES